MASYNTTVISQLISDALAQQGHGSQTRLAQQLGVRVQTVNKWAQGQTNPHPERWDEVEVALGLEPGTFARASGLATTPVADERALALARLEAVERALVMVLEHLEVPVPPELRGATRAEP